MAKRGLSRKPAGQALAYVAVTAGLFIAVGLGMFHLMCLLSSGRQNDNAAQAGARAVAKAALKYPYYDLTLNPKHIPLAESFLDVADDSPAGNGNKVVNLENINSVWARALLVGLNYDALQNESSTIPLPPEAAQNVIAMHAAAQSISDELANLIKNDPKTKALYTEVFNSLALSNSNARYLNSGNSTSKSGDFEVSYLERGGRSNVKIAASSLANVSEKVAESSKKWLDKDNLLTGYNDDVIINVNGEPLHYQFVPLAPESQPHLVSNVTFAGNNAPQSGDKTFSWANPVPNTISILADRKVSLNGKDRTLETMAAALAQTVSASRTAEFNRGYLVLENAEGLNLDTRTPGPLTTKIGTNPTGPNKDKGVFSAADYANAQLLVQRSQVDPIGGSNKLSAGMRPIMESLEAELDSTYLVKEQIAQERAAFPAALSDPYAVLKKLSESDLLRLQNNLTEFGTLPDPKIYPLHARLAALQKNKLDPTLIVKESGLKEYGTSVDFWLQDEQMRDNRRVAGMNVLPFQPYDDPDGVRSPLRDRIWSAAYCSPTTHFSGVHIGRDGTPFEYLQGDHLSTSDIDSRYTAGKQDKLTPTCTLVRWRIVQRIRLIDATFAAGKNFPEVCFDEKFKNLTNFGYALSNDELAGIDGASEKKLLKMGQRSYIYKDNVQINGKNKLVVVMRSDVAKLPQWLKNQIAVNDKPDGNELLFQGRFFDGTNHKLTNVLINVPGDRSYARPYFRSTDINARDRYAWYPCTGAKNLLGWLRFETVLNRGYADSSYEQVEQQQGSGAINFNQVIQRDEQNQASIKFKDQDDIGDIRTATGCQFFDIYDAEPDRSGELSGLEINAPEWDRVQPLLEPDPIPEPLPEPVTDPVTTQPVP